MTRTFNTIMIACNASGQWQEAIRVYTGAALAQCRRLNKRGRRPCSELPLACPTQHRLMDACVAALQLPSVHMSRY